MDGHVRVLCLEQKQRVTEMLYSDVALITNTQTREDKMPQKKMGFFLLKNSIWLQHRLQVNTYYEQQDISVHLYSADTMFSNSPTQQPEW